MSYSKTDQMQKSEKYYQLLVVGSILIILIIALIVVFFGGREKKNQTSVETTQASTDMKYEDSERQIREIRSADSTIKDCKEESDKIICKNYDGEGKTFLRNLEQNFRY